MEPRSKRIANPEPARFPHEHQKRRLEGIVAIVRIGENSATNPQNHRAMAFDKHRERKLSSLAASRREPLKKLAVRKVADRPHAEERLKLRRDVRTKANPQWKNLPPA